MKVNESVILNLRNYQKRVVNHLWHWFKSNETGNPLLKIPTAGGKTYILSQIILDALSFKSNRKIRVLILTQRTILVKQNSEKFTNLASAIDIGILSAKLNRKDLDNQVLFAGIQSIYTRKDIGTFDLVIVDECHEIPTSGDGMYKRLFQYLSTLNPKVRIVGLTATDYRLSSGKLTEGKNCLFEKVVSEVTQHELLGLGYVVPIRYAPTSFTVSMRDINVRCGNDYNKNDAALEMMKDQRTFLAINESVAISRKMNLQHWKFFCTNVTHCHEVKNHLKNLNIKSEIITGEVSQKKRNEILNKFKAGDITALLSCETLLTGFDESLIEVIINLKPTKSKGRWVQLCGRGVRPHTYNDGRKKEACLLLDYTENTLQLGRADVKEWNITSTSFQSEMTKVEVCKHCQHKINPYSQHCDNCMKNQDEPRILKMCSEWLLRLCESRSWQLTESSSIRLYEITSFKLGLLKKKGELVLDVVFFGVSAETRLKDKTYREDTRPVKIIREEVSMSKLPLEFVDFFTTLEPSMISSHVSAIEFKNLVESQFVMPQAIFTSLASSGVNESLCYLIEKPKRLHWSMSNEDVMRKIKAAL